MFVSLHLSAADSQLDSEALEVDDDEDDHNSGKQVGKVRSILSVEGILESIDLVTLGKKEMEEGNNGSFEFSALVSPDGDG